MTCRVVGVLLVVALVLARGSVPFAHVPPNRRSPWQRELVGGCQGSADELARVHRHGQASGTTTLVGDRRHHLSVALATVAVAHPSVRVGATFAVAEVWEAGIAPDFPDQPVPVAANTRPNRPPRVVLAARAPPV